MRSEGSTGTVQGAANAFAGKMQLDIAGDEVTVTSPAGTERGHYKVVREDATTTVIARDAKGGVDEETLTLVDPRTLKWNVSAGQAVIFTKE